jgi:hypothetical protein
MVLGIAATAIPFARSPEATVSMMRIFHTLPETNLLFEA